MLGHGDFYRGVSLDMLNNYCSQFIVVKREHAAQTLREYPEEARPIVEKHLAKLQARVADLTALLLEA